MWRQDACRSPIPPACREIGDPHLLILMSMYVFLHTHMNVYVLILECVHRVCVCICVFTCYASMYVLEGGPALLAFTSTATEHLCLALLLVATVTKAQSGVAAAAKQSEGRRERNGERLKDFACRPDHNSRNMSTDTAISRNDSGMKRWV